MGLTIHYKLALPRPVSSNRVNFIVQRIHQRVEQIVTRLGLAGVSPIIPAIKQPWAVLYRKAGPSFPDHWVEVKPTAGWCFTADVGAGCEPVMLGLCKYPKTVQYRDTVVRTRCSHGWRLESFSKTQYASLQGTEHFLKCHRAVIDLLLICDKLGVTLTIKDEGDYWPGRNEAKLLAEVGQMNQLVAALGGALKDAADEGGPAIEAPIFQHGQFELLEAQGLGRHPVKIQQAVEAVKSAIGR
jgi:hypothetical protein